MMLHRPALFLTLTSIALLGVSGCSGDLNLSLSLFDDDDQAEQCDESDNFYDRHKNPEPFDKYGRTRDQAHRDHERFEPWSE